MGRRRIVILTSVELLQVVLKDVKKQETKMREEEVAAKSRDIQVTILQWHWSPAETFLRKPVRGQKIEEHVVTDLDLRNDENRPS